MRSLVHRDTLEMAQTYERAARLRLVRMNMIRAGLDVKGKPTEGRRTDAAPPYYGGRGVAGRF